MSSHVALRGKKRKNHTNPRHNKQGRHARTHHAPRARRRQANACRATSRYTRLAATSCGSEPRRVSRKSGEGVTRQKISTPFLPTPLLSGGRRPFLSCYTSQPPPKQMTWKRSDRPAASASGSRARLGPWRWPCTPEGAAPPRSRWRTPSAAGTAWSAARTCRT